MPHDPETSLLARMVHGAGAWSPPRVPSAQWPGCPKCTTSPAPRVSGAPDVSRARCARCLRCRATMKLSFSLAESPPQVPRPSANGALPRCSLGPSLLAPLPVTLAKKKRDNLADLQKKHLETLRVQNAKKSQATHRNAKKREETQGNVTRGNARNPLFTHAFACAMIFRVETQNRQKKTWTTMPTCKRSTNTKIQNAKKPQATRRGHARKRWETPSNCLFNACVLRCRWEPPLSSTSVLWVSRRDPPGWHRVQCDSISERHPVQSGCLGVVQWSVLFVVCSMMAMISRPKSFSCSKLRLAWKARVNGPWAISSTSPWCPRPSGGRVCAVQQCIRICELRRSRLYLRSRETHNNGYVNNLLHETAPLSTCLCQTTGVSTPLTHLHRSLYDLDC